MEYHSLEHLSLYEYQKFEKNARYIFDEIRKSILQQCQVSPLRPKFYFGFCPIFPHAEQCAVYAENYFRRQRRLVTRPIRCFLGHNQFPVSTQHHVRIRNARVCVPRHTYRMSIALFRRPASGILPFSRVFRYEIIASVRYTKLLLHDSALKYISLISLVILRHDLNSSISN